MHRLSRFRIISNQHISEHAYLSNHIIILRVGTEMDIYNIFWIFHRKIPEIINPSTGMTKILMTLSFFRQKLLKVPLHRYDVTFMHLSLSYRLHSTLILFHCIDT